MNNECLLGRLLYIGFCAEKDAIAFMLLNADDEIKAILRNDTDKQENEKPAELK